MHNRQANLPLAPTIKCTCMYSYCNGEAKFSRIFGTPVLVNFGAVIVECKNVLPSNNEEVEHV